MIPEQNLKQLETLADEVSRREGCRLYDLEFSGRGGARVLRVFIDSPEQAVNVDHCANVSRGLSLLLDVQDLIPGGAYELEVSSPGIERVLKRPWHYQAAIGEVVKVKTVEPLTPESRPLRKNEKIKLVQGQLTAADDQFIVVDDLENKENWKIPIANIHRAQVVFDYGQSNSKQNKVKTR